MKGQGEEPGQKMNSEKNKREETLFTQNNKGLLSDNRDVYIYSANNNKDFREKQVKNVSEQAKDLNSRSSKGDTQVAKEHVKRCSTSLVIREMEIETAMGYRFTE